MSEPPTAVPSAEEWAKHQKEQHSLCRQNATLTIELSEAKTRKRKRGTVTLTKLGRTLYRLVSLFLVLHSCVSRSEDYEALLEEQGDSLIEEYEGLIDIDPDERTDAEQARVEELREMMFDNTSYKLICRHVPGFRDTVLNCTSSEELQQYYNQLRQGAKEARSTDLVKITHKAATFLNKSPLLSSFELIDPDTRSTRGVLNERILRVLLPVGKDWKDPTVLQRIRDGVDSLGESFHPVLFYPKFEGDINDIEKGYLMGEALVYTAKLVLTSPSSADTELDTENPRPAKRARSSHATKMCNAELMGMEGKMTGRVIAYIAVLLHFSLTDAGNWSHSHPEYLNVDYRAMYTYIVDFFEDVHSDADRARINELLRWWNQRVFPQAAAQSRASEANKRSRQRLTAQRRAKNNA